jgi:hypothetical protein
MKETGMKKPAAPIARLLVDDERTDMFSSGSTIETER